MKNKKMVALLIIVALIGSMSLGCTSTSKAPDKTAESPKVFELRSADVASATGIYSIGMKEVFIKKVAEYSDGTIKVNHFPGGQLGSDQAVVEGLKLGTIDMALVGTVPSKITEAFFLPFLFKDIDHFHKVVNGPIGDKLKEKFLKENSIRLVQYMYITPRMTTANKPLKSVLDFKGLKIRVPQMAPMVAAWKALGANPTPIAFSEQFTALQQGIVEAEENPLETIISASLNEVQKYVINTDHGSGARYILLNNDLWNKFDDKQKEAFTKAAKETTEYIETELIKQDGAYKKTLKDKGMIFLDIDRKPMMEATKDVWKDFAPQAWGEGVYEEIQALAK